jgi:hypothetical protein
MFVVTEKAEPQLAEPSKGQTKAASGDRSPVLLAQPNWSDGLATLVQIPEGDPFEWETSLVESQPKIAFASTEPAAIMQAISDHVNNVPIIVEGLADSPTMATGTKTRDKVFKQLGMMKQFAEGDYGALFAQIDNPKEGMSATKEDMKAVLEPLAEGLTTSDWKVLGAVGVFHDVGKLRQDWARDHQLDLTGYEGIAHDFDSEALLKHNPELLKPFDLNPEETKRVELLCRLHSLPGMHALGEGNASAYAPLFEKAREDGNENLLKIARTQGLLDVMSALGTNFNKYILSSHANLSKFVTNAFQDHTKLSVQYRKDCALEMSKDPEFVGVSAEFGIGPVAMKRLKGLSAPTASAETYREALGELSPEFVYEFNRATDDQNTWFGTYVNGAFGSGLRKAKLPEKDVIQAMVKMVACASAYKQQMEPFHGVQKEWALSAFEPQQVVNSGDLGAAKILEETKKLIRLDDSVKQLSGAGVAGLTVRSGKSGIEIGYLAPARI